MKTFEELGLSPEFVSVLEKAKITIPSEIQEKTIPLVLAGKDVIGGSATGSGKTLAFASSIIENLETNNGVQALILTPTRELAEQVSNSIAAFATHKRLKTLPVYGGVDIERQIREIRKTDVVVGTPGRILDHLRRGTLKLGLVKFLILDEVDRMFDMGFQHDVEMILSECPKQRQTMLFSATISSEMDHLARKYTKKPEEVSVKNHIDASKLKQIYYDVQSGLKFSLFVHLLKEEKAKLVMVFCATRRNVDFVADNLNNLGISARAIHGGLQQNKRNRVLDEFNNDSRVNVLVCTDVAARGLDISGVSHVYNYDLPKTSDDYIHRIGRTARAGKDGIAINILSNRDYENFGNILRDEKIKIEEVKIPLFSRVKMMVDNKKDYKRSGSRGGSSSGSRGRNSIRNRSSGNRDPSRGRSAGRNSSSRSPRSSGSRDGLRRSLSRNDSRSPRGRSSGDRDSSRGRSSFGRNSSGGAGRSRTSSRKPGSSGGKSFGRKPRR